jgi:hypothetical protein
MSTPNISTYVTLEGTDPSVSEPHEARLLSRTTRNEGLVQMMSEIGDGLFCAWGSCARCHETVQQCKCAFGPQEPEYIRRWRDERFETSVQKRLSDPVHEDDSFNRPLRSPLDTRRTELKSVDSTKIDNAMDEAMAAVKAAQEPTEPEYGDDVSRHCFNCGLDFDYEFDDLCKDCTKRAENA